MQTKQKFNQFSSEFLVENRQMKTQNGIEFCYLLLGERASTSFLLNTSMFLILIFKHGYQ